MEYSAIFHDMDKRFCYAIEKDLFVIRVQVKKDDMKEIILHYEDKYIPMEREDTRKTIVMKKVATSQFHDYYTAFCPRRLAAHATPRPWFPSVAVKKVACPNSFLNSSEERTAYGSSLISFPTSFAM